MEAPTRAVAERIDDLHSFCGLHLHLIPLTSSPPPTAPSSSIKDRSESPSSSSSTSSSSHASEDPLHHQSSEFAPSLSSSSNSVSVPSTEGVCGRVLKRLKDTQWEKLSDDPGKRLSWVLDSEGLGRLLHRLVAKREAWLALKEKEKEKEKI